MADTGAPWNLPYPLATDLVRDGAQAIQDLAEATADGLSAAGGLVAVKHVLKTNTFSATLDANDTEAIPGLAITHAVADAAHDVYLYAVIHGGRSANIISAAITADGTMLALGDAEGIRVRSASSNATGTGEAPSNLTLLAKHTPESTASVDYGINLIGQNAAAGLTYHVNRSNSDGNNQNHPRTSSVMVLMEVKV